MWFAVLMLAQEPVPVPELGLPVPVLGLLEPDHEPEPLLEQV